MAATTPPRTQTKSASRLSKLRHHGEEEGGPSAIPHLSLEIVPSSPRISTPSPPSTVSPRPPYTLPLKDLLMLSPSPAKRSKPRHEMADDVAIIEGSGLRKRYKTRNSGPSCAAASPRGGRRLRRRLEQDVMRDDKEFAAEGDVIKPRKKRHGERSRAAAKSSAPTPSVPSPKLETNDGDGFNFNAIGEVLHDLIMWKDVSKSSLWFGLGSISFLSSCFVKGVNFSIFSLLCQVGLLFLGISFFSNSVRPRDAADKSEFRLKEDDILRFSRLILPVVNLAVSKTGQIFSGEPAMTLKVVPIFLAGAEYGHLITLWRLSAIGFFISFTCPKLCSVYSSQLSKRVECVKLRARDAWASCGHKKIVAASAVTAFWNLTSIRTRVFAGFMCLVILRYHRQRRSELDTVIEEVDTAETKKQEEDEEKQPEKALAVVALVDKSSSQ